MSLKDILEVGYKPKQRGFALNLLQKAGFEVNQVKLSKVQKDMFEQSIEVKNTLCEQYDVNPDPSPADFFLGSEEPILNNDFYEIKLEGETKAFVNLAVIDMMFNQGPGVVTVYDVEGHIALQQPVYQHASRIV